jgi:aldehyde dehydrogenase (NAD+)
MTILEPNLALFDSFEAKLLVDGRLVDAGDGRTFPNIDPYFERELGVTPDANVADAEAAVLAARRAFDETSWADDHAFRARCLRQLHTAVRKRHEDIRQILVSEVGCPVSMTRLLMLDGPTEDLALYADQAESYRYETALPQGSSGAPGERLVLRRPFGVVVAISPYNYPLHSLVIKTAPALAAGNTVVTKPSPLTPWTAALIGRLIAEETDIPPGVFNVISSSSVEVAETLVRHPAVDMVTFTGSTAIGREILRSTASTVKKSIMELGGKSPHLILEDADITAAVRWGLLALFRHAGQGCTKLTRVLLPRSRYEEGLAAAEATAAAVAWGNPRDERTIMGPLVSSAQRDRVMSYIARAHHEGAKLLTGGTAPERHGFFVEPTAFYDVAPDATIAQEEIFGPVAAIIPYDDLEEGILIANGTEFGLSAAVWGASPQRAIQVARRIRAGTITINGTYWHGSDTPFGGMKQSGLGREQGIVGFEEFLDYQVMGHPRFEDQAL